MITLVRELAQAFPKLILLQVKPVFGTNPLERGILNNVQRNGRT